MKAIFLYHWELFQKKIFCPSTVAPTIFYSSSNQMDADLKKPKNSSHLTWLFLHCMYKRRTNFVKIKIIKIVENLLITNSSLLKSMVTPQHDCQWASMTKLWPVPQCGSTTMVVFISTFLNDNALALCFSTRVEDNNMVLYFGFCS